MPARPLVRLAATLVLAVPLAAAAAAARADAQPDVDRRAAATPATAPHGHFTEKTGLRPTKVAPRRDARAPLHDHGVIHKQR